MEMLVDCFSGVRQHSESVAGPFSGEGIYIANHMEV